MNRHRLTTGLILLVLGLITACASGGKENPNPTSTPLARSETVTNVEPQTQALMLRLTSPEINLVTELDQVTVAGVTSPDATLSVNGRLVLPNLEGLFSIDLDFLDTSVPMLIEVIASSITGETQSEVRAVISSGGFVRSGLFGTLSSGTPSEITLETESSVTSLFVDAGTSIAIPGWKSNSISDITTGTLLGVTKQDARAESILAVPVRPVLTRHFTGGVTASNASDSSAEGKITLLDSSQRKISAITTDEIDEEIIGSLVTAILEQDISSGALRATAIDPALNSARRLHNALEMNQQIGSHQTTQNVTALRWRLSEHGVNNISMLLDQQPTKSLQTSMKSAEETYTRLFSQHHIGPPSADVTGLITSIATSIGTSSTKLITVQPKLGQPVMVKLSENTPITVFGGSIKSGQLDLASRITARYSINENYASKITVMSGNTLSFESSAQLAAISGQGEVQGILMDVIDSELLVSIMVDQETGRQISLRSEEALVFRNGTLIELDASLEGSNVFAWFDPTTYRLLEMESLDLATDEKLVAGVVHSFIPKYANGNVTIRTIDGKIRTFTHHADTVIRRDGLRVSIHHVRPGDLVRPNTKVRMSDGVPEILSLSLKTPELRRTSGFIRGVMADLDGQVQVTVSNNWLELISLKVNSNTRISQQGRALTALELKAGQKINLATYDPVTLETSSLSLNSQIISGMASR